MGTRKDHWGRYPVGIPRDSMVQRGLVCLGVKVLRLHHEIHAEKVLQVYIPDCESGVGGSSPPLSSN